MRSVEVGFLDSEGVQPLIASIKQSSDNWESQMFSFIVADIIANTQISRSPRRPPNAVISPISSIRLHLRPRIGPSDLYTRLSSFRYHYSSGKRSSSLFAAAVFGISIFSGLTLARHSTLVLLFGHLHRSRLLAQDNSLRFTVLLTRYPPLAGSAISAGIHTPRC